MNVIIYALQSQTAANPQLLPKPGGAAAYTASAGTAIQATVERVFYHCLQVSIVLHCMGVVLQVVSCSLPVNCHCTPCHMQQPAVLSKIFVDADAEKPYANLQVACRGPCFSWVSWHGPAEQAQNDS